MRKNESYYYKVEDQNGQLLSSGPISCEVYQAVGVGNYVLAFLSILAIVLQVFSVFLGKDSGKHNGQMAGRHSDRIDEEKGE
jgi:hypothetical protein